MKTLCSVLLVTSVLLGISIAAAAPPDYPLRCRGAEGMARSEGRNLFVQFTQTDHAAGDGLDAGQCSWDDRGFRPNEPTRIVAYLPSIAEAQSTAAHINAGDAWTFWVYNTGTFMRAVDWYPGFPKHKPVPID